MIHARRNEDDRRIGAVFNSFICVDIDFVHFDLLRQTYATAVYSLERTLP